MAEGFDDLCEHARALGMGGSDGVTLAGGCGCLEHGLVLSGRCVSSEVNMGFPERLHKLDFSPLQLRYTELKCLIAYRH